MPLFLCRRVRHLDSTCDYCPRRARRTIIWLDSGGEWHAEMCAHCYYSLKDISRHAMSIAEKRYANRCNGAPQHTRA